MSTHHIISAAIGATGVAAAIGAAPAAHADPVANYAATTASAICSTLDDYPTLPGVSGVAAAVEQDAGFTPYQAGEVIYLAVDNYCPRHLALLARFANTYAGTTGGSTV